MNNPRELEREELIAMLASGEVLATDSDVAQRLAADPELAKEVQELREMALAVESCGRLREEALAATTQTPAIEEHATLEGFRAQIRESRGGSDAPLPFTTPASAPGLPSWARLAAGLLLFVGGAFAIGRYLRSPAPGGPGDFTGNGGVGPSNVELGHDTMGAAEDDVFGTLAWTLADQPTLPPQIDVRAFSVTGEGDALRENLIFEGFDIVEWPLVLDPELVQRVDRLLFEVDVTRSGEFRATTHRVSQER